VQERDSDTEYTLFIRGRQAATFAGMLIGLATLLAVLSNSEYYRVLSEGYFPITLFILCGLGLYWTYRHGSQLVSGFFVSSAVLSLLMVSPNTIGYVQAILSFPYLGTVLLALLLTGGLLITRS